MTHPDLFDAAAAIAYLRLDSACSSIAAARSALGRLAKAGEIHPLRLGKRDLFMKPDLDAFVARQIERLAAKVNDQVRAAQGSPDALARPTADVGG